MIGTAQESTTIRRTDMRIRKSTKFEATNISAREAICSMIARLEDNGLPREKSGAVEIALSEAINNVVEHAYSDDPHGTVHAVTELTAKYLTIEIRDTGRPYPDLQLPAGKPADLERPVSDLPEGGFGWFLIRELTDYLSYQRNKGENILILRFDLSMPGKARLP